MLGFHLPGVLQHVPLLLSVPWHDAVGAAERVSPLLRAEIGPAGLKVPKGGHVLLELWDNKVVHSKLAAICEGELQRARPSLICKAEAILVNVTTDTSDGKRLDCSSYNMHGSQCYVSLECDTPQRVLQWQLRLP